VTAGWRARCVVDLDAVAANTQLLQSRASGGAAVMAVVKADAYGHGMIGCARAALRAGAAWLGTATLGEALELRAADVTAPILAWLLTPGEPELVAALSARIDVSASSPAAVAEIAVAARAAGAPARIHLEVDTGLSRGGARLEADWRLLVETAVRLEHEGAIEAVGIWSHLVEDDPRHPTTDAQLAGFTEAVRLAEAGGLRPEVRHLAKSTAALWRPDTHFDLVRPGLALYGLTPDPDRTGAAAAGLHPAMSLRARVALTKQLPAGAGISYGHTHHTTAATGAALVPIGYADGIPRAASGTAQVLLGGRRRTIAGRVCMDQFVVETGADAIADGDEVVLFGSGDSGEPTAQEWADACGTINYEIVTRIGARVPRVHVGAQVRAAHPVGTVEERTTRTESASTGFEDHELAGGSR
jgi:alanine racemase